MQTLCWVQKHFIQAFYSSLFYPRLPPPSVLEWVGATQTACFKNKSQCSVSETGSQWFNPHLSHRLSSSLLFSLWSNGWAGVSLNGLIFIHLSSECRGSALVIEWLVNVQSCREVSGMFFIWTTFYIVFSRRWENDSFLFC